MNPRKALERGTGGALSYVRAVLDLDLERVAKPHEIKVVAYSRNGTALLRLLHPNIVVHPLIEWSNVLVAAPTPLALRSENGSVRVYVDELNEESSEIEIEPLYDVHYLDPLSVVALAINSARHRVISATGSYSLELEVGAYAPCIDRSYAATPNGVTVITHSSVETITSRSGIHTRSTLHPLSRAPMRALAALSENLLVVSDGIYGATAWIENLDRYLSRASQAYLLNDLSIALVSENSTAIVRNNEVSVLPKGFVPYAISENHVIGFFSQSNSIALYDAERNELQKLFPSNCRLLAFNSDLGIAVALCPRDSRYLLIALELSGSAIVLELNTAPIHAELAGDALLLSYPNRSEVYRLSYGPVTRIELICTTKPLYSCRYLGSKNVACIDSSGRILVVDLERICCSPNATELRSRSLCAIYVEDTAKQVSLIGRVVPSFAARRLDLIKSVIEIESPRYQQLYIIATGSVYDTPLLIESTRKVYGTHVAEDSRSIPRIALIELGAKLYIRINTTNSTHVIVSSRGINYIDREALLDISSKSLIDLYRVERLSSEPTLEFWKRLQTHDIQHIDLAEKIDIALRGDYVCIESPSGIGIDAELELELVCREGVHRIRTSGCIPLKRCQNLVALQICLSGKNGRYCAPLRLVTSIAVSEVVSEIPTVKRVFDRIVVVIPRNCISIRYTLLTLSPHLDPVLRLSIDNRCAIPVPVMILKTSSDAELQIIDPRRTVEIHLPIDPTQSAYSSPVLIALEPAKPRTFYIDIGLREMLALAHSIALKVSLLLGARRWPH